MDLHIFGIMFVDFPGYFVQSATFDAQVGCSPDAAGIEKNPFSRGEGGPPERKRGISGSEEECGRQPESQHNKTDLRQSYH